MNIENLESLFTSVLRELGEDVKRDGLVDTPHRVAKAWQEMLSGYKQDPEKILGRVFEDSTYDQMVVLDNIEFQSTCEHHLLPFVGTATVAYIPNGGRIVGLSKLARLVDCFAKRLQIQERMTQQIASAIETHLKAKGVAVILRAHHSCMSCRGVMKPSARMITSCMKGVMLLNDGARAELMSILKETP